MLTVVTIILIFVVIIALFMAVRYKEDNSLLNEEIEAPKAKRKVLKKTLNSQKKARK